MGAPKNETALLAGYDQKHGEGTMYLEVGIGGSTSPWEGSSERRVDGVVVSPSNAGAMRKKRQFARDAKSANWTHVDLVEAKAGLTEGVIGQLLCARAMWPEQHSTKVRRMVAAYRHEDPAMVMLARQLGITLHRVPPKGNNAPLRLRPRFRLTRKAIADVGAYRDAVGGRFLVRVPLTGQDGDDGGAGAGPAPTFANFVRLQNPSKGLPLALLESEAELRDSLATHEPELVIQAPELTRGRIGIAVCQSLFFEQRYGVRPKATIVCRKADPALLWVCREGLGELGVVGVWEVAGS